MPLQSKPRARSSLARRVVVEPIERRALLDGLTGQYFNRLDFTEPVLTRLDPTIDFTWSAAPASGVNADFFSARWTGRVVAPKSEVYTFWTQSDDGVRLWVDGRLLVDNWVNQGNTDRSGTVALEAGKSYDVRLDYYDYNLGARINLAWSSPTTAKSTVPAAALFAPSAGLAATYFDNVDLSRPALSRVDPTVNFAWPGGTPAPGTIAADGFGARWSGQVVPQFSQTYQFFATPSDAGATVRLRVDGKLIVDSASVGDDGRITLEAGERYDLQLEYADPSGAAGVTLEWASPSVARQAIPNARLYAAAPTAVPTRRTGYTNPILNIDAPDPGVIFADGAYWMLHTTGGPNSGWPLWRSTDQVNWGFQKNLLTTSNKQSWMNGNYWAPELHKVGNAFVLTGTSLDSRTGRMTIAMASSATVNGNYAVRAEPLVSDSVHVLDSNVFIDDDGTPYLLWKRDGPTNGTFGSIRIRRLDATGLNFAAGSSESILLDNAVAGWERNLAEAPWLVRRADAYYLFYSGGFIDTTYSIGVARGTSLTQMFARSPANPILTNNANWGGPGHGAFTFDRDGTLWHQYHARLQSNPNAGRKQLLDPVVWTAAGWPSFANGGTPSAIASGPRVAALTGTGVLAFAGDVSAANADDVFRITRSTTDTSILQVYLNDALLRSFPFAEVQTLTIDGKGGNDTLLLDYTRGEAIPGGGITFTGGAGVGDAVTIDGAAPADVFRFLGSNQIASGSGLLTVAGVERLNTSVGTVRFTGDASGWSITAARSQLSVESSQHLASLTLIDGAVARLASAGLALVTHALTMDGDATLDLGDAALIVDYANDGPSPLADLDARVRAGRGADASWSHPGIISSVVAADASGSRVVGTSEASRAFGAFPATLAGQTVDASAVLVRPTLVGDATLDRAVNFTDLLRLAQRYGQPTQAWADGDFTFDGVTNFADLLLLAQRYGTTYAATMALPTTATAAPVVSPAVDSADDDNDDRPQTPGHALLSS